MRKTNLTLILTVAVVLVTAGAAWAGSGDTCNESIGVLSGVTSGELESGSRWYSFQADGAGSIPFNTSLPGTEFATTLAIYGTCGGAPIATSEGTGERNAYINLDSAFGGQQFYIEVGSLSGSGHFDLAVDAATQGPVCPGVGDCFSANGSIACDDTCSAASCPGCCALICAIDAFCCDSAWDSICADAAVASCVVVPVDLKNFQIDG